MSHLFDNQTSAACLKIEGYYQYGSKSEQTFVYFEVGYFFCRSY